MYVLTNRNANVNVDLQLKISSHQRIFNQLSGITISSRSKNKKRPFWIFMKQSKGFHVHCKCMHRKWMWTPNGLSKRISTQVNFVFNKWIPIVYSARGHAADLFSRIKIYSSIQTMFDTEALFSKYLMYFKWKYTHHLKRARTLNVFILSWVWVYIWLPHRAYLHTQKVVRVHTRRVIISKGRPVKWIVIHIQTKKKKKTTMKKNIVNKCARVIDWLIDSCRTMNFIVCMLKHIFSVFDLCVYVLCAVVNIDVVIDKDVGLSDWVRFQSTRETTKYVCLFWRAHWIFKIRLRVVHNDRFDKFHRKNVTHNTQTVCVDAKW